jgi:hypothetical protein
MVTAFLWTNNINVPCKPPTHVFEGKVRQKKWGQYTSKYGIGNVTWHAPTRELHTVTLSTILFTGIIPTALVKNKMKRQVRR